MVVRAPQVVGLAALLLAACDSPARVKPWRHAPDPTAEAANAPGSKVLADTPSDADVHAARAHTLRIHVDAEPGRLNPVVTPSSWARRIVMGTIFEPLLRYEGGRYAPRLARSWQVSPDGLEILIELQPDVTFDDGRPMTSSDVQFTLDSLREPRRDVEPFRSLLADVDAVELVGPLSLRIRLKRPSAWVLRALAELPVLPMHVYDGSLLAGGALVGTGPYKLASNKGGVVHLVRNEHYWGGPAAISDLEFVYEPDAAVALTAAKRGDLDVIPALIPAHWPEQANAPGITAAFAPLQLAPPRLRYLAFNAAHTPLDDPRVRHALALLIDRRAIAKHVFGGLARPVLWPIWPGGPVDGPEAPVPDFDPATAGKLLDAAGWTDSDKDGIRDQDGKQLRLLLVGPEHAAQDGGGPQVKTERDYFVDAARRAGVIIDVKTGGDAFLDRRMSDGSYDLIEMSWSGLADTDLSALLAGKSPRIDRALDALATTSDPAARVRLAPELAAALAEAWPLAGIVAPAPQGLIARRLAGVTVSEGWLELDKLSFR